MRVISEYFCPSRFVCFQNGLGLATLNYDGNWQVVPQWWLPQAYASAFELVRLRTSSESLLVTVVSAIFWTMVVLHDFHMDVNFLTLSLELQAFWTLVLVSRIVFAMLGGLCASCSCWVWRGVEFWIGVLCSLSVFRSLEAYFLHRCRKVILDRIRFK